MVSCTKRSSLSEAPDRFMHTKRVFGSAARLAEIHARVVASTQRSMTPARPLFSAAAMMGPAVMMRPSGSRIRSSTSKLSDSCGDFNDMIGCISRNMPSVALGEASRATRFSSASRSWNAEASRSYTTRPSRRPVFASRQARSAVETASFICMPGDTSIRPTEPRTVNALSPTRYGVLPIRSTMPRQISEASGMAVSGMTMTNSSPPTRPICWPPASMVAMRSHTCFNTSSPAEWPNRSLISLKRSRSM